VQWEAVGRGGRRHCRGNDPNNSCSAAKKKGKGDLSKNQKNQKNHSLSKQPWKKKKKGKELNSSRAVGEANLQQRNRHSTYLKASPKGRATLSVLVNLRGEGCLVCTRLRGGKRGQLPNEDQRGTQAHEPRKRGRTSLREKKKKEKMKKGVTHCSDRGEGYPETRKEEGGRVLCCHEKALGKKTQGPTPKKKKKIKRGVRGHSLERGGGGRGGGSAPSQYFKRGAAGPRVHSKKKKCDGYKSRSQVTLVRGGGENFFRPWKTTRPPRQRRRGLKQIRGPLLSHRVPKKWGALPMGRGTEKPLPFWEVKSGESLGRKGLKETFPKRGKEKSPVRGGGSFVPARGSKNRPAKKEGEGGDLVWGEKSGVKGDSSWNKRGKGEKSRGESGRFLIHKNEGMTDILFGDQRSR